MSSEEVLDYVKEWLNKRKIKVFFKSKIRRKEKYVKMKEKDLYNLCYKLVDLIQNNIE